MKLQYLGDSKDSFTWDYHHHLAQALELPLFNIALMMTADDSSSEGRTHPTLFPAADKIIELCELLRADRSLERLKLLSNLSQYSYRVAFHRGVKHFCRRNSSSGYFAGIASNDNQLFLLDPDNGFEPEKSLTEKHVRYDEVRQVINQLSEDSVLSVFQHHRRKPFADDFVRIRERLGAEHTAAIHWHSIMFVLITKTQPMLEKVIAASEVYAQSRPVRVIA